MAADTLAVTDFLLACIEEQEGDYRKALGYCLSVDDHRTAKLLGIALRDCEAKRRIVETHDSGHECPGDGPIWTSGDPSDAEWTRPCDTLLALAAVHANHPDYRDEWRA